MINASKGWNEKQKYLKLSCPSGIIKLCHLSQNRESNPGPAHYECAALPSEPSWRRVYDNCFNLKIQDSMLLSSSPSRSIICLVPSSKTAVMVGLFTKPSRCIRLGASSS